MAINGCDLNMKERRELLQLKPGSQIPGYTGHRTGLQFGFGNTYGELTHLCLGIKDECDTMNRTKPIRRPIGHKNQSAHKFHLPDPKNDSSAVGELLCGSAAPYNFICKLGRRNADFHISPPTGFKSGYTGYIPRLRYQYGRTYNSCSEDAVKEFDKIQLQTTLKTGDDIPWNTLAESKYQRQLSHLVPVISDKQIKARLQDYKFKSHKDAERTMIEAPPIGYQGYTSRVRPSTVYNCGTELEKNY